MRVRLFALLGSLALLAILGAPTLAMSVRERGPAAPWQWTRGTPGRALPGPLGRVHVVVTDEQDYLTQLMAQRRNTLADARELARSPNARVRAFGAALVERQSAQVSQLQRWLHAWYRTGSPIRNVALVPDPQPSVSTPDRALLRDMIGDQLLGVTMSQQLLEQGLALHPAVVRLAAQIRDSGRAETMQLQRLLGER